MAFTVPLSVAVVPVTKVAAVVTTVGGGAVVVKVISGPYTMSPPDVTPLALKWYKVEAVSPEIAPVAGSKVLPVTDTGTPETLAP